MDIPYEKDRQTTGIVKKLVMQVSNKTNYLIYWKMVSFVYSKILLCYLLNNVQNFL